MIHLNRQEMEMNLYIISLLLCGSAAAGLTIVLTSNTTAGLLVAITVFSFFSALRTLPK